jgi:type I restriction enzyme S subunit
MKLLCGYHLSMLRTINNKIDGRFLFWALKDEVIATQLWREATGITRWAIASKHIKNSTIPFPPKPEQTAIADYLDKACADIDRVMEIKQKQIDNLQKQLKSIINQSVTKGLYPNAEMKESGIRWIGKVPKHWRKEKIFRAAEFVTSGGTPKSGNEDFYFEGDIYWIQSGDLNDGYITETEKKITREGLDNSSAKLFPKNTLLVAMYGATIGKLGIQTMEAATNQACCAIYPVKRIELKFLYYFFLAIKDKYISDSYGGGQPNISQSLIKQTYFFVPDKKEQILIYEFLDNELERIKSVQTKIEKQIETLLSYKKSLIHEVITGKKQVYSLQKEKATLEMA